MREATLLMRKEQIIKEEIIQIAPKVNLYIVSKVRKSAINNTNLRIHASGIDKKLEKKFDKVILSMEKDKTTPIIKKMFQS